MAKLFFAYGLGNAHDLSDVGRRHHGAAAGPPDARRGRGAAARTSITVFFAVPTFYAAFLASPNAPQKIEVKIRRCVSAGEALPEDIGKRWKERYGVEILDGLGSTEMLHIFLTNRAGRRNTAPPASRCPATRSSWSATTASQ